MWPVKSTELLLAVRAGQLECALRHADTTQFIKNPDAVYASADIAGISAALSALQQQLKRDHAPALPGCRIRVLVSDQWVVHASVPWRDEPEGWSGLALTQALEDAGYSAAVNDRVRLERARYGAPAWLVAWPEPLLFALQTFAENVGGKLASVLPLSVLAVALAPKGVGMVDGAAHGIARPQGSGVPVHWRGGDHGVAALAQQWQRLQLRDGASNATPLPVLDLDAVHPLAAPLQALLIPGDTATPSALRLLAQKAPAAHPLDAIAPAAPPKAWWAVAAVAASLLFVSSHALWRAVDQRAVASGQSALQVALPQPHLSAPVLDAAQLARVAAVNRAIGQLNLPLDTVLQSLVPDPDLRVAVLDVQLNTSVLRNGQPQAQITVAAQAMGSRPMADYVSALAQEPALHNVWLTQHEQQGAAYHFTVEASYP